MEKIVFYYFITIIIPSLISLFTIGNIVYTIGEFKEHSFKVPDIMKILLVKILFLSILQVHTFHYLFHNYIPENFYFISIFINLYVIFEMLASNKYVVTYRQYLNVYSNQILNELKFKRYILKTTKKILKTNLFFFTFTEIFGIIMGVMLIVTVVHNYSLFNYLIMIVYICIFATKYFLSKYMSTL